jgi:hypothetical protein
MAKYVSKNAADGEEQFHWRNEDNDSSHCTRRSAKDRWDVMKAEAVLHRMKPSLFFLVKLSNSSGGECAQR